MENIDIRGSITGLYNKFTEEIYNVAKNVRYKSDDLLASLLDISIMEFCDFNNLNYIFMQRFMHININEKKITLNSLGEDAVLNGDSDNVTNLALHPSYVSEIDYDNFMRTAKHAEKSGSLSTRTTTLKNSKNYSGEHNELYLNTQNLYPDELNVGEFNNKWKVNASQDSILYKTKQLFNKKKINTIISSFHTNGNIEYNGSKGTDNYKESHGRNLLKKGKPYMINGYDNPYCRVWTHHYKYDSLYKTIRPFHELTDNGSYLSTKSLSDFHKWKNFETEGYGWKNGDVGWEYSVLQDNGMPNITPKFLGGGKSNIHTKQCMFSIENLAWKDFDPYSFEKALSWEQRGPNGGRIMWFPPYGLSFNENTQAIWNSNSFIGRGEDVYTYVNTKRTGTLSFLMLVDHPSIINYASWHDKSELNDEELLQFLAGCDGGDSTDSNSLLYKTKPTPLTDEYIEVIKDPVKITVTKNTPPVITEPKPVIDEYKEVNFFTFYPNNYSGYYDFPLKDSNVDTIAYLLCGEGAQKHGKEDTEIRFENITEDNGGYEILLPMNHSISDLNNKKNYIIGSKKPFNKGTKEPYVEDNNKLWYYRIDGKYEIPKGEEIYLNNYGQTLFDKNGKVTYGQNNLNYQDSDCLNLNLSVDAVANEGLINDVTNYYSLNDIAGAIAKLNNYNNTYNILNNRSTDNTIDELYDIFENYELESIKVSGYSNNHGYNNSSSVNVKRNNYLANNRANTVKEWLKKANGNKWRDIISESEIISIPDSPVLASDKYDTSSNSAKIYRSALTTMVFRLNKTIKLSETDQTYTEGDTISNVGNQKYKGFSRSEEVINGYRVYINIEDNTRWIESKENETTGELILLTDETSDIYSRTNTEKMDELNLATDNKIRYDQEYYFFKYLEVQNPIVFKKLTDKIKYFDPAFHSMTPEGFNARLTFLQQCTRQGDTITRSDINGKTANNLAFGRPPFCVLRIGDFYNQMIVIDSINVDYSVSNGIQWDLNTEGIGMQPLLANININFTFIGGGDLTGPIRRLQNALTFNYYANTRLYDNRADRYEYDWNEKTGKNETIKVTSYAHNVLNNNKK